MNSRRIIAYTGIFQISCGVLLFYALSSITRIESFKLFNVIGLFFDIIGVLLLSKLVTDHSEKHRNIFDYCYFFFIGLIHHVPLGIIIGSVLLFWLDLPSSNIVTGFGGVILLYVAAPLYIIDYSGEIFELKFYKCTNSRIIFMGWYLLLSGLALQMVGALKDLTVAS